MITAYLDHRAARVRPDTHRVETHHLAIFGRFAEERRVLLARELSRPLLDDFAGWLLRPETSRFGKEARKPQSARRIAEAALACWRWAEDSERWPGLPRAPRELDLPRGTPPAVVEPTWAEMDACVAAAEGWIKALATWLRYTGLRVGESMLVEWRDVDMVAGTLRLRPEIEKVHTGRTIPLHPALLDWLAGMGRREGYLLPCGRKGREARGRDMARAWKRAGVRAEVWEGQPDHAFRGGFKTGLLRAGAHPDAIDFLQGHRSSGSRGRYIDGSQLPLVEALALVPVIGQAGGNVVKLVDPGRTPEAGFGGRSRRE